jgi:conjugal transfer ATP-binding protein TraC
MGLADVVKLFKKAEVFEPNRRSEKAKKIVDFFVEAVGLRETEVERQSFSDKDLKELFSKSSFSKYIMPVAYDEERGFYVNQDGTIGIMYECVPALFLSRQAVKTLSSLFNLSLPKGTIMQFIFFADPYVEHYLYYFVNSKERAKELPHLYNAYCSLAEFYRNMKERLGFPARNFRVFFTLKFVPPKDFKEHDLKELKAAVKEILSAAGLYPLEVSPSSLLFFLRCLLNDIYFKMKGENYSSEFEEIQKKTVILHEWNRNIRLNRQVIKAETEVEAKPSYLKFGKKRFRCLTYKTMPERVDFFFGNMITGVYELFDGIAGDAKQVSTPFMVVFNIFCDSINTEIQTKANLILQQQGLGTYIVTLKEKIDEYLWAVKSINDGEKFLRCFLTFWVFSEDEDELRSSLHKYARILEGLGGVVQEETVITLPLFVYSLPFGGIADKTSVLLLDRDFVLPMEALAASCPCQGDFMGTGEAVLLFLGRKGQVVGLDLFSQKASSYNFFVAAPTGKGKSFFVNYIAANYFGAGAKVRIIDIGGSYKKLCSMFGGLYLEFSPESNISINPFASIYEPQYDIPVVVQMIATMTTAVTEKLPEEVSSETAYNMIQLAVSEVLRQAEEKGIPYSECTIDDIYFVLANFMEFFPDADKLCGKEHCVVNFDKIASHLAFNLYKFTSAGIYGKWFSKKNNFSIEDVDFVVLELEHLKKMPDLFKVVTLAVLNNVTASLYLSDRKTPTLIILDEAWQFLQDSPAFEKVVEEGYRRARKYKGSFGVVTQDILDFDSFGRVGKVILANSPFKFFLQGTNVELAKKKNIFEFDDFTVHLVKSVRYNAPRYSEIFVMTDNFGSGVVRLMVDDYSYYIYTSNPAEIFEIEEMVKSGMSYDEAIKEMVRKYRQK